MHFPYDIIPDGILSGHTCILASLIEASPIKNQASSIRKMDVGPQLPRILGANFVFINTYPRFNGSVRKRFSDVSLEVAKILNKRGWYLCFWRGYLAHFLKLFFGF